MEETTAPAATPETAQEPQGLHHAALSSQMHQISRKYMVPNEASAHEDWHTALSSNHDNNDSAVKEYTDYVKSMAQGLYPTLAKQIGSGVPTESLLAPYKMIAKSVLGSEAEPNWQQPHWNKALTGNIDEATGRSAPMGLEQWRQELISNPTFGYSETPHAREMQKQVMQEMTAVFHGMSDTK